ncbi:MAG: tyrosine-protein kinase domain-containing protein [Bacteroidia bacterium]
MRIYRSSISNTVNKQPQTRSGDSDKLDIKGFLFKLLDHWYYFAISLGIFIALSLLYIKSTAPVYEVSTTLLISQPTEADMPSDAIMQGLRQYGTNRSLENEIGILTSYNMIREVIAMLNLEVAYFEEGTFRDIEQYQSFPFYVELDTAAEQAMDVSFYVELLSEERFRITAEAEGFSTINLHTDVIRQYPGKVLTFDATGTFGEDIVSDHFTFRLYKAQDDLKPAAYQGRKLYFTVKNPQMMTDGYRAKLAVATISEEATVVDIHLKGTIPNKEIDFLRTLCNEYIRRRLTEKNHLASKTIEFIDAQLSAVGESLETAENELAQIRANQGTMDPTQASADATQRLMGLEAELADLNIKMGYYQDLLDKLTNPDAISNIVAPSTANIDDPILNNLVLELKQLNSEKVTTEFIKGSKALELEQLNKQIVQKTEQLIENVRSNIVATQRTIDNRDEQASTLRRRVRSLPRSEIDMTKVIRKLDLTDNLYNYLVQKRTEAGITRTANTPDSKVLDEARKVGVGPVAPNKGLIMALAGLFGMLIPILFIYAKEMMDDTVKTQAQIEQISGVPVLGTVAHNTEAEDLYEVNNLSSDVVESLRYLKINLQFIDPDRPKKIISVTSTIPQEGKTFCAFNLASVAAISGHKVLVIGADIRKPSLYKVAKLENEVGLTNYLINQADVSQIIQKTHLKNLDAITSGPIPPNPSDLLNRPRFGELIASLREHYEFIIIDTPPVGLVSDFMLISQHTDINLYVLRHGFSKTHYLEDISKLRQLRKRDNIYIILNDAKFTSRSYYGYRYGKKNPYKYGYEANGKSNGKNGRSRNVPLFFNKKKTISV